MLYFCIPLIIYLILLVPILAYVARKLDLSHFNVDPTDFSLIPIGWFAIAVVTACDIANSSLQNIQGAVSLGVFPLYLACNGGYVVIRKYCNRDYQIEWAGVVGYTMVWLFMVLILVNTAAP